ncbi:GNAT family N-acetyltransferase [Sphingomonas oleivorans]|uniref:GNAT family N-acetyltransferase n=1 Tax=Sphingomonas oleivorans TaxID=1735121 RepID=A0A2T5FWT8_9SPHN|nr:GNAT family N-acetyltransferase [Sphingomonas oleivorans]PTQ10232.1 GNAT family N-acetyltransferase [Sphingomonas oleivorans]
MNNPPTIRPATPADAAALALVGAATFLESYAGIIDGADIIAHSATQHGVAVYAAWLADPTTTILLAEAPPGGAPIGYIVLTRPALPVEVGERDMEIKRLYLLSKFHGAGLGRALMEGAAEIARAAGQERLLLGVYGENHSALAFYAKSGFLPIGHRQFSVGSRSYDDIILARSL